MINPILLPIVLLLGLAGWCVLSPLFRNIGDCFSRFVEELKNEMKDESEDNKDV